jgi:hypothetical protein
VPGNKESATWSYFSKIGKYGNVRADNENVMIKYLKKESLYSDTPTKIKLIGVNRNKQEIKIEGLLVSCHRAQQLYRTDSLHPPGHPATAAVPRTAIKDTHCTIFRHKTGAKHGH